MVDHTRIKLANELARNINNLLVSLNLPRIAIDLFRLKYTAECKDPKPGPNGAEESGTVQSRTTDRSIVMK